MTLTQDDLHTSAPAAAGTPGLSGVSGASTGGGVGWRRTAIALVVALLATAIGVGLVRTAQSLRPLSEVPEGGCGATPPGPATVRSQTPGTGAMKLREGQTTRVAFGRSVSAKVVTVYLDLTGSVATPGTALLTRIDTFRRPDDGQLRSDLIVPKAVVTGRTVILTVCFGRVHDHLGDPGTYSGSITIDDPRLTTAVTVPFTVTMQYLHESVLLWLLLLAMVPGTWVLWVVHTSRKPAQRAVDAPEMGRWLISVEGVVSVAAGGVAATSVFIGTYLRDPTWGSSALQPITLYGAMFSAFVTTAALTQITHLASRKS